MDAVRIKDETPVLLKLNTRGEDPEEISVGRYFSAEPLAHNSRNHCIPLYEVLDPPGKYSGDQLLVMPLLRVFDDPPFTTIGEVVEFFAQIIEVLSLLRLLALLALS